jgi:hypothetical protein
LHAVEGWGKTSLAAQFPKPIFIQTRGETGLETLIDSGRLPEIPHFPEVQNWEELTGAVRALLDEPHDYKTLALDTVNGGERLCHEFVCQRDFNGIWNDQGFEGYKRGYEVSLAPWREFLGLLDRLRAERTMTILLLCHTKVKQFKNPEGADYDRYAPDMHDKTWGLTHKWADVVLFGNFDAVVVGGTVGEGNKAGRKGKAIDQVRVLYTERHAAYDAKNRLGLPTDIEMGGSPQEAFTNLVAAIKSGRATQEGVNQ